MSSVTLKVFLLLNDDFCFAFSLHFAIERSFHFCTRSSRQSREPRVFFFQWKQNRKEKQILIEMISFDCVSRRSRVQLRIYPNRFNWLSSIQLVTFNKLKKKLLVRTSNVLVRVNRRHRPGRRNDDVRTDGHQNQPAASTLYGQSIWIFSILLISVLIFFSLLHWKEQQKLFFHQWRWLWKI